MHLRLAFLPFLLIPADLATAQESVRAAGYFCNTRQDQVAFLAQRMSGESEIMAANAVNKAAGMQTCADYMSVEVIPGREKVVTSGGYIFKVQSFTFLPEKQEHWAGTVTGALEQVSEKNM